MKIHISTANIFLVWVFFCLIFFYFGFYFFPHSSRASANFLQNLANWDGQHYIGIAEFGYSEKFQYAFFPLYPLVIRAVTFFTKNYLISALLISFFSTFLGVLVLNKLISLEFSYQKARETIIYLLIFPTAFFFLTAYSDGFFFLLVSLTFYFKRKQNLLMASLVAALAALTRVLGVALIMSLLIQIYLKQGLNRKNWVILLSPLGIIIYSIYLYIKTSDPFYFIAAQSHWERALSLPSISFWHSLNNISSSNLSTIDLNVLFNLLFAIFGVGMVLRSFRFVPSLYSIFGLVYILIPLTTSSLESFPRFLLPVFPIFILVTDFKKSVKIAYAIVSLVLLIYFSISYINGYWVS